MAIVPLLTLYRTKGKSISYRFSKASWLGLVLILSAVLRLARIAWNEIEGDEALILMQATQAIAGREDIVFWHKKGPAELLIPMVAWLSSGTMSEGIARAPFAILSIAAVLSGYEFSRRSSGKESALISAALIATNGYFVAYGRIVQYQSVILLMVPLAFAHLVEDRRGSAFLAGLFMGFALLAHYDAMIVLPAFGYALLAARWTTCRPWSRILFAACGVLMVTLPFYGPFLLSEGFEFATSYLIGARISGSGPLFRSNYAEFLSVDAIYNSSYYFLCLGFMLLVAILRDLSRWGRASLFGVLLLIPTSMAAAVWGSRWVALGIDWSFLPSALLLGFCVIAPRLPWHRRALWLWFAAAYLFYLFVVADPRTHIYNVYVPGVFLAGDALQWLWRGRLRLWPSPVRYSVLGIGILLLALIIGFPFNVFVRTDRDYAAGYPNSRLPVYWGLSTDVPKNVYFGIPHHVGWKAVTELMPDTAGAVLYNSNEVPRITDWYLPQGLRIQCNHPDFYFIDLLHPDHVYSSIPVDRNVVDKDYGLVGVVTVAGRPSLEIYQRGQVEQAARIYRDEDFGSAFDRSATPDRWLRRLPQDSVLTPDVSFGDSISLLGYSIEKHSIGAGETFRLVLYWRTSGLVEDTYVVFIHLIKDGVVQQGSGDSLPDCGAQPTSLWVPGELIVDAHEVHAFDDAACEDCGVFIGLYDLYSGARVPAYTLGERTAGDTVYLTTVEIRPD